MALPFNVEVCRNKNVDNRMYRWFLRMSSLYWFKLSAVKFNAKYIISMVPDKDMTKVHGVRTTQVLKKTEATGVDTSELF
jgi:hypothetical protein